MDDIDLNSTIFFKKILVKLMFKILCMSKGGFLRLHSWLKSKCLKPVHTCSSISLEIPKILRINGTDDAEIVSQVDLSK